MQTFDGGLLTLVGIVFGLGYTYLVIDHARTHGARETLKIAMGMVLIAAPVVVLWPVLLSLPSDDDSSFVVVPAAAWFEKLIGGDAFVLAPKSVRQYESFKVTLVVIPAGTATSPTQGVAAPVGLSPVMRAELLGADIEVDEKGVREQAVSRTEPTKWTWAAKSDWPGTRSLHVRVDALAKVAGQSAPRMYDVADHAVTVRANPIEFVRRNWAWCAATLAGLIAGAWRLFAKRKEKAERSA